MEPTVDNYKLKRIDFNNKKVAIVLQNTNGPCPLLAVANILLLRGDISIHEDKASVGADELLGRLGEYLLDARVEVSDTYRANHESNVNDVIQMLPKTQRGIDVNVQFKGITAFEFTSEMMLFDFCNARLVHGWLVDPQDKEMYNLLHNLSYNQLVEKQIELQSLVEKNADLAKKMSSLTIENKEGTADAAGPSNAEVKEEEANKITTEGLLSERFSNETATQLTYHGLSELHSGLKDEELVVFFRNNHFSTVYKHNGELLLLVTDQGYAKEPLVWEKLCQIDGDSIFYRSDYSRYEAMSPSIVAAFARTGAASSDYILDEEEVDRTTQSDRDLALAMQMQQEENQRNKPRSNSGGNGKQAAEASGSGSRSRSSSSGSADKKDKKHKHKGDCVVQ